MDSISGNQNIRAYGRQAGYQKIRNKDGQKRKRYRQDGFPPPPRRDLGTFAGMPSKAG